MQLGSSASGAWAGTWFTASIATPSISVRSTTRRAPSARPRATAHRQLEDLVAKLDAALGLDHGAGGRPHAVDGRPARELLEPGDTIIDGGNSRWSDDKRRQEALARRASTMDASGGVWGLQVGYCMMVGGPGRRWSGSADPRRARAAPRSTGPAGGTSAGAGHYVKMVHNGVEYGMMQAYAEGFALFDACEFELDNAKIAHLWMQGSVVRSWLCELAALAFEQEGNDLAGSPPMWRTRARAAGRSRMRSTSGSRCR